MSEETKTALNKKKPILIGIAACIAVCAVAAVCLLLYFQRGNDSSKISVQEAEELLLAHLMDSNQWSSDYVIEYVEPAAAHNEHGYSFEIRYKDTVPQMGGRLFNNYVVTDEGKVFWYDSANDELIEEKQGIQKEVPQQADNGPREILEVYDSAWSEDKIIEELNKRKPYLDECSFYGEILDYAENVAGIRDISMYFEPLFDTDSLYYSEGDFVDMPSQMIQLAEREIYARHGCKFKEEDWNKYFMGQLWYVPVVAQEDFDDAGLNKVEKTNLALIQGLDMEALRERSEEDLYNIKGSNGDSLILDKVEWVADEERAAEIGIGEDDMPGGFYIYNEEEKEITCSFAEECSFTILENHYYPPVKVDKQTFLEGIDGAEFLPPYHIRIEDGKIISVWEQYVP